MQSKKFDVIVVGQGLAGSILVNQLFLEGKSVAVFENNHLNTASWAAIGIHNPLIIKRLRKSWRAKEFIEYCIIFYDKCASQLNVQLRQDLEIHRVFASETEERTWQEKSQLLAWEDYIDNSSLIINDKEKSTGRVKMSGWLNVPELLKSTKSKLVEKDAFFNLAFDYSKLEIKEDNVFYSGVEAQSIIFCEGYKMSENPFFSDLPMQKVKGEILIIEDEELQIQKILKTPVYILPIGGNQYKVGATFDWDNFDESTSDNALNSLINKIAPFTSEKMKIISQIGGVRPTVSDRRPLIGRHQKYKNLYILNGLGTRGVTLGPYFSRELCNYIFRNEPINEEVDIQRFN